MKIGEMDTEAFHEHASIVTPEICELLQSYCMIHGIPPSHAMAFLFVTIGKISGELSGPDITLDDMWQAVTNSKVFFQIGFDSHKKAKN